MTAIVNCRWLAVEKVNELDMMPVFMRVVACHEIGHEPVLAADDWAVCCISH